MMKKLKCPGCRSLLKTKAGFVNGKQRYHCKNCGLFFTENNRVKTRGTKALALHLYIAGAGIRQIERMLGVHSSTITTWVKKFLTPEISSIREGKPNSLNWQETENLLPQLAGEGNAKAMIVVVDNKGLQSYWTEC